MGKRKRSNEKTPHQRKRHKINDELKKMSDQTETRVKHLPRWRRSWNSQQLNDVLPMDHERQYYCGQKFPWDDRSVKNCSRCQKKHRNQFYKVFQPIPERKGFMNTYYKNVEENHTYVYMCNEDSDVVETYCERCEDNIMSEIRTFENEIITNHTTMERIYNSINGRKEVHQNQKKFIAFLRASDMARKIWDVLSYDVKKRVFSLICTHKPTYYDKYISFVMTIPHAEYSVLTFYYLEQSIMEKAVNSEESEVSEPDGLQVVSNSEHEQTIELIPENVTYFAVPTHEPVHCEKSHFQEDIMSTAHETPVMHFNIEDPADLGFIPLHEINDFDMYGLPMYGTSIY